MPSYDARNLQPLIKKLNVQVKLANEAAAKTVNETALFAFKEAVEEIASTVNLKKSYINGKMRVTGRATSENLTATISSRDPRVLLSRYPFSASRKGVRIAVNKGGSRRSIPKAFIARNLRGSAATGIALRKQDALEYFERAFSRGRQTPGKNRKLARLRRQANAAPRSIEVLHSRTVNQLFESVRDDIQPQVGAFMTRRFIKYLERFSL